MNLQEKFAYVADEVKKVEKWAEENRSSSWYDDFEWSIRIKLRKIEKFAKENSIPFVVNSESIAQKHYDDTEGYSEEESSSYYYDESDYEEEETSDYEDDDEEDEDYEESSEW